MPYNYGYETSSAQTYWWEDEPLLAEQLVSARSFTEWLNLFTYGRSMPSTDPASEQPVAEYVASETTQSIYIGDVIAARRIETGDWIPYISSVVFLDRAGREIFRQTMTEPHDLPTELTYVSFPPILVPQDLRGEPHLTGYIALRGDGETIARKKVQFLIEPGQMIDLSMYVHRQISEGRL